MGGMRWAGWYVRYRPLNPSRKACRRAALWRGAAGAEQARPGPSGQGRAFPLGVVCGVPSSVGGVPLGVGCRLLPPSVGQWVPISGARPPRCGTGLLRAVQQRVPAQHGAGVGGTRRGRGWYGAVESD